MHPKVHSDGVNMVREALSKHGVTVPYTVGNFRRIDSERVIKVGKSGVADTLFCPRKTGRFIGVETKVTDTDSQRQKQKDFERILTANGGLYLIADFRKGRPGVENLLKDLVELGQIDAG